MENWWEHAEDREPDARQDAELEQFEARQRRMYQTGKILVYLIAGIHIFSSIVTFFTGGFKPVRLAVHILLAVGLICGVSWVRYLYIAGGVWTVVVMIMAIPALMSVGPLPFAFILTLALSVLYTIVETVLLLTAKSIKEYMYQRRAG